MSGESLTRHRQLACVCAHQMQSFDSRRPERFPSFAEFSVAIDVIESCQRFLRAVGLDVVDGELQPRELCAWCESHDLLHRSSRAESVAAQREADPIEESRVDRAKRLAPLFDCLR